MNDAGTIVALGVIGYYFQNKTKEEVRKNKNNTDDTRHWKEVKRSSQINAKKIQEDSKIPDETKRVSTVYRDIGTIDESEAVGTIKSNEQKYIEFFLSF